MQLNRSPIATRDRLQAVKEFYESLGQLSLPNLNDPKCDSKLRPFLPFFDKEGNVFITHFPINFYPDLHLVKDVEDIDLEPLASGLDIDRFPFFS